MERLELLLSYLKENPNDSFLLFAIAKEYEKAKDEKNAEKYYKSIVEKDENYVGVYYHFGKLKERNLLFSDALKIYRKGMEVAKKVKDNHSYNELAGAKMNLEDDDED
jgi:tetratricopeptide (TPR) repeat protein